MKLMEKIERILTLAKSADLTPQEKIKNIKQMLLIGENRSKEEIRSSIFMVTVGILLIVFIIVMDSYFLGAVIGDWEMRVILALAAGSMAVGFTGNINIKLHWVQASGSLAIVVLFYAWQPDPIKKPVASSFIGIGLFPEVYAQDVEFSVADDLEESASGNEDFVNIDDVEVQSLVDEGFFQSPAGVWDYEFEINYPIGIGELKQQSINLSQAISSEKQNTGLVNDEVEVYSLGSYFRAPLNALIYDGTYHVVIEPKKYVNPNSVVEIREQLEELLGEQNVFVVADSPNASDDSDIGIQLINGEMRTRSLGN